MSRSFTIARLYRVGAVIGGLAALALLQHACDRARALEARDRGEAQWIWGPRTWTEGSTLAFYAWRDVSLAFDSEDVEIEIMADEEYVLSINGQNIGSGLYRDDSRPDRYRFGRGLVAGTNRIAVELRSRRAVGAFWFRLVVRGSGEERVFSDGEWRMLKRFDPALFARREPLNRGVAPDVLGYPPVGRWRRAGEARGQPTFRRSRASRRPWPARTVLLGPGGGDWEPFVIRQRDAPALGPWVTFDWERSVSGYLSLAFKDTDGPRGLIWFSDEPLDPRESLADTAVVGVKEQTWWTDSVARSFRYVTVVGLLDLHHAEVYPLRLDVEGVEIEDRTRSGVLGLDPPRLVTPIEHEVWRELESVSGFGDG